MEKRDIKRIIRSLAKHEGVSEHTILKEIEKAIQIGYSNTDPEVQDFWQQVPARGAPSPFELIAYIGSLLKDRRQMQ